jgi:thioredoxin reductase (NADPH)
MHSKVVIIGSGPAGYTAAIYAARAMLEPVLVAGVPQGGQLTITTDVENYPGFAEAVQGPWLMEQMRQQAENVGTRIVHDLIAEVDLRARPFRLTGDTGKSYTADTVIIATGAQAKWLGLPSEEQYKGFGVSACATCDGFFFKDRKVVVVGGGNTAVEEALFLTRFASKVTLIHRRDSLRAERILQNRLLASSKIEVVWNAVVEEILGTDTFPRSIKGVRVRDVVTGSVSQIDADGLFVAIGHAPAVEVFRDQLRLKPNGYLWTEPGSSATSVPGVFAAGDVTDETYRQAVTAAGMGCMAALDAERYLSALEQAAETEAAE